MVPLDATLDATFRWLIAPNSNVEMPGHVRSRSTFHFGFPGRGYVKLCKSAWRPADRPVEQHSQA
jgi:hypothetical protein